MIKKIKNNPSAAPNYVFQFLNDPNNAQIVAKLKTTMQQVGWGIIIATLIEDVLTAGAGIADDWASFAAARMLLRAAAK